MPFCIPAVVYENSCCSTSLPVFDVISVLDFGRSNGYVVEIYLNGRSDRDESVLESALREHTIRSNRYGWYVR